MKKSENVKFTVECEMPERWTPHFLSMLRYMQQLGVDKQARIISIYSDGADEFKPIFKWDISLKDVADPIQDENGDRLYDAGPK